MSESIENTYSDDVCNMDVCDNTVITPKSDFVEMMNGILGELNIKMSMFLFIIGMFLFSDMFINSVLSKFDNTIAGECTTTKGTIIQLTLFILCYLVLDLLMKGKLV